MKKLLKHSGLCSLYGGDGKIDVTDLESEQDKAARLLNALNLHKSLSNFRKHITNNGTKKL